MYAASVSQTPIQVDGSCQQTIGPIGLLPSNIGKKLWLATAEAQ